MSVVSRKKNRDKNPLVSCILQCQYYGVQIEGRGSNKKQEKCYNRIRKKSAAVLISLPVWKITTTINS